MEQTIDYALKIKTANITFAGTDNDVFITVYGEKDGYEVNSGEINLSAKVSGNAFEKNAQHNLSFPLSDMGRPTKIKLRLGNDLLDCWNFAWCKIKRNGSESEEVDPEINKEVTFDGKNKEFSRKDSFIFYGTPGALRENIVSQKCSQVFGGVEFITLPPDGETQINIAFTKEISNVIERSSVTQNGTTHTINVGGELSLAAPSSTGCVGGKGSASYGFSYSTLKTLSETTIKSLTETTSKETSIKIVNSGNMVTEYISNDGFTNRTIGTNTEKTFAIIYEKTVLIVQRTREGAVQYNERIDELSIGRRVRAVLPLTQNIKGELVYKDAYGKEFEKDNLWDVVNI